MTVPLVRVAGSPFDRGRLHGAARAAALRAFLDDDLCRLNRILPAPVSMKTLRPVLADYHREISSAIPQLLEEIHGLAAGAGIEVEQAVLLQVRREIMGYQRIPVMGDCTTYARLGDQVLAQTIDLNGDLDDQVCVLDTGRALVLSFAGLLGYLGVNDHGLAIGLNLVLGGDWRPGVPPYLAIRHLLDTAASVGDALAALDGLRLASSRSLTLCDTERALHVEILGDQLRVVGSAEEPRTNHFLHPDFVAADELNVFARNSSVLRRDSCAAALAELPAGAGVDDHFAVLGRPPVRVDDTGDIRREKTVATVVVRPGRRELHVRRGAGASDTHTFRLGREHADV